MEFGTVLFDASSHSYVYAFYEAFGDLLFRLSFPAVLFFAFKAKRFDYVNKKIERFIVLFLCFLMVLGFVLEASSKYGDYRGAKYCLLEKDSQCVHTQSRITEIKTSSVRSFLKTDSFEIWLNNRDDYQFVVNGNHFSKLKVGQCIYTVHSKDRMDRIYLLKIVSCNRE